MSDVTYRLGELSDIPSLQRIERDAGQMFRTHGMDVVADDDPPSAGELSAAMWAGRVLVAEANGAPVAYILTRALPASQHIEQLTVHPQFSRRGIGAELIRRVSEAGVPVTLTTFRDVPWNAPYYAQLGFDEVHPDELSAELQQIVTQEAAEPWAQWPRIVMQRG